MHLFFRVGGSNIVAVHKTPSITGVGNSFSSVNHIGDMIGIPGPVHSLKGYNIYRKDFKNLIFDDELVISLL
jgi:hypothetical protein